MAMPEFENTHKQKHEKTHNSLFLKKLKIKKIIVKIVTSDLF